MSKTSETHSGATKMPPIQNDEIPFGLPASWSWETLGNLCTHLQRGKSPEYVEKTRFIDPKSFHKYTDERILAMETYYGILRAPAQLVGFVFILAKTITSKPWSPIHTLLFCVWRAQNCALFILFSVPLYIQDEIISMSSRSTNQTELNTSTIRMLPVPIAPLAEQRDIIVKVNQLMSLRDELEEKLKTKSVLLEKLTASILTNWFLGFTNREPFFYSPHPLLVGCR